MDLETKVLGILILIVWGIFAYLIYYDLSPLGDLLNWCRKERLPAQEDKNV